MAVPLSFGSVLKTPDGDGCGVYSLCAVLRPPDGPRVWRCAREREARRPEHERRAEPPVGNARVDGQRKPTLVVALDRAAEAVAFALAKPLEDFFDDADKRAQLAAFVGGADTVEAVYQQLLEERDAVRADLESALAVLPALGALEQSQAVQLQTTRHPEHGVLVGVYRVLEWLGFEDHWAEWSHGMKSQMEAEIQSGRSPEASSGLPPDGKMPLLVYYKPHGERARPTPFTNRPGLAILLRLLVGRNSITDQLCQQAFDALLRIKVGDESLFPVIAANAAAAPAEAREFMGLAPPDPETQECQQVAIARPAPQPGPTPAQSPRVHKEKVVCMLGSLRSMGVSRELLRPYVSDVAARLLSLKCNATMGTFQRNKLSRLFKAHKYSPEDATLFYQAVDETHFVLRKRARELTERTEGCVRALALRRRAAGAEAHASPWTA